MMSARKKTPLLTLLIIALVPLKLMAQEHFNLRALEIDNPLQMTGGAEAINQGMEQVPGKYRVSVYVNNNYRFTRNIMFSAGEDNKLHARLRFIDLVDCGVTLQVLGKDDNVSLEEYVSDLPQLLPGITANADLDNLKLSLIIPQKYTDNYERGSVAMAADTGLKAAFVDYDISGSQMRSASSQASDSSNYFIGLHGGLNLNAWHLRNTMNISSADSKRASFQSSYIERSIPAWQSRLTIGESYTSSDIFDGLEMRGAQVSSQDDMLDDNEQGFSPVIRGIAPAEAKVTIYRKGYSIYQTYVAAGPFELKKLPAEAGDGEIEVRVTTLDGKETTFKYNFSSLPIMQREGISKYVFAIGRLNESTNNNPEFLEYTHARGVTNGVTIYGGILSSRKYSTVLAGVGISLGSAGALSLDIAGAMINGDYATGGVRSRYYKVFDSTGTMLSLTNSFYPDKGFMNIEQAVLLSRLKQKEQGIYSAPQARSDSRLNLSQQTFAGTVYLSLTDTRYRSKKNNELSLNAGYTFPLKGASLTLNIARVKHYLKQSNENQYSLLLQVPLNIFSKAMTAGISVTSSGQKSKMNTAITGTALDNNRLSYSLQQSRTLNNQTGDAFSMSANYYTSYGLGQLGYAADTNQKQINYGLQGGLVVHSGGMTLSQPLGETFAVVNTQKVGNVYLANSKGIHSDPLGYLIAPSLTAYRKNTLRLVTSENDDSTEIVDSIQTVIPDYGAVSAVNFRVRSGTKVLFTIHHDKSFVPFGATVTAGDDGGNTSIAGTGGSVYLSGLKESGILKAQWGKSVSQSCTAAFDLKNSVNKAKKIRIIRKDVQCV